MANLREIAKNGVEASEEMLTEVANILSDAMVMGERSGLSAAIQKYEEQGLTKQEAGLRATLDSLGQVAWAGAGGFLSGVGMAGGKLGIQQGGNAIYDGITRRQQSQTAENVTGAGVDSHLGSEVTVDTPATQSPVEGLKTPSTAIDTNPETHTAQQQAVINEYQGAADKGILAFIERWRRLKDPNYRKRVRMDIAPVDQRTVTDIKAALGVDVSDFTGHSLSGNALEHIDLRHGAKGEADHSMADLNDIARMGYVLEHYDSVEPLIDKHGRPVVSGDQYNADGSRAPLVRFLKRVDGTYYVVEAVPDSAAREFRVVSAYMEKTSGNTDRLLNVPQSDPQPTSKTPDGAYASAPKNSIPQTAQDVNMEMAVDTPATQSPVEGVKNAPMEGAGKLPRMTMADFTDTESPVWRNVAVEDAETKSQITQNVHRQMVDERRVVTVPEETIEQVSQFYPDVRAKKRAEKNAILKPLMDTLKTSLRKFLRGMKGSSFEFEVNGNVLEATLYGTGIREVMEKVTQDKASMLYHSAEIFKGAQYLYSTPDYNGDPNIYRWNYFYTPVQIGDEVVGVRIALRDMAKQQESQIYNWGIKKGTSLDGEGGGISRKSHGVSSDAPGSMPLGGEQPGVSASSPGASSGVASMDSIPQTPGGVNPDSGDAGYWDSLMETVERGEAVDQGEVETEETINARIQGAMSEWMKSLNQVNAQAEVRVDIPEDKRSLGQKAKDAASSAYRQFVDSGAEIEKMGKDLGDKTLYPYYNAARQSTSAAGYMLQEGGRQMSVAGEAVGPSLADIFQPIQNK